MSSTEKHYANYAHICGKSPQNVSQFLCLDNFHFLKDKGCSQARDEQSRLFLIFCSHLCSSLSLCSHLPFALPPLEIWFFVGGVPLESAAGGVEATACTFGDFFFFGGVEVPSRVIFPSSEVRDFMLFTLGFAPPSCLPKSLRQQR